MLPGRLLYWSGYGRTGYAYYGGMLFVLRAAPRLLPVDAAAPLDYYALHYMPHGHMARITMRGGKWRERDLTPEERLACDRMLDAMSRAPQAVASGDRAGLLALLRLVGVEEA